MSAVGTSVPRKDGIGKATGAARYADDIVFPGMLHGRTVRSTVPRGRIRSIRYDFDTTGFTIVDYRDVPAKNAVDLIAQDQPFLVESEVRHMAEPIVLLAHDGALRREEIVQLRVDDIDWQTHTIAVRAAISKNKMPGIIMLSRPTWTRLKEYVEEDRATLAATFGVEANGPIFLSDSHRNPGQPLSKWTVKDIFDRISDALQIPQLTPHKMRHLMLTELKKSGMDLVDVSRYARHRTIASTEIYLHTDLSDLARQVNKAHQHLEKLLAQMEEGGEDDSSS